MTTNYAPKSRSELGLKEVPSIDDLDKIRFYAEDKLQNADERGDYREEINDLLGKTRNEMAERNAEKFFSEAQESDELDDLELRGVSEDEISYQRGDTQGYVKARWDCLDVIENYGGAPEDPFSYGPVDELEASRLAEQLGELEEVADWMPYADSYEKVTGQPAEKIRRDPQGARDDVLQTMVDTDVEILLMKPEDAVEHLSDPARMNEGPQVTFATSEEELPQDPRKRLHIG